MGLVFESLLSDLLALLGVGLALLTYFMNSNFNYWKKRGVYSLKVQPFFGNFGSALRMKKSMAETLQDLYMQLEGYKYGGVFNLRFPVLVVRDPELIKHVLVKDFKHFEGRGIRTDPENNPLIQHLFALTGPVWRSLRTKLTPTFTSGKMKMMFQLIQQCSVQLKDYLSDHAENGDIVEMKEVLSKFTTDVIGTCAFGLQFNSMGDEHSEFRRMGRKIFQTDLSLVIKRLLALTMPRICTLFKISVLDEEVTRFFLKAVKDTVDYRQKNKVKRNDFLQLLIQLREEEHEDDQKLELTDSLMAAQVFVFFVAGFETSSTTMSFAVYELALNPDIQARLRKEVDATLEECDGQIAYDAIQKMEYMDKVIAETLRKYPPAANLQRECSIPYKLPDSDVIIEKGVLLMIPVFAIQRDPQYYPDPEVFDPERFSEENKAKRHHFTYLPFGEGPRICIGMRFGLLQSKIGLFTLLANYEFSVCERTEIPIKFNPKAIVTSSTSGTVVKITKRT